MDKVQEHKNKNTQTTVSINGDISGQLYFVHMYAVG